MYFLPFECENVSQIETPRPSSVTAPSTWYEDVAVPHKNPFGKLRPGSTPAALPGVPAKAPTGRAAPPADNPNIRPKFLRVIRLIVSFVLNPEMSCLYRVTSRRNHKMFHVEHLFSAA